MGLFDKAKGSMPSDKDDTTNMDDTSMDDAMKREHREGMEETGDTM